jgi:hypothetical protein
MVLLTLIKRWHDDIKNDKTIKPSKYFTGGDVVIVCIMEAYLFLISNASLVLFLES